MSGALPASEENIRRAAEFVLRKWRERAAERGLPEPADLSGSCKFSSIFASRVFGGRLRGNPEHQFCVLPGGAILDLNREAADVRDLSDMGQDPWKHDHRFWGNPDHRESMASCLPRVEAWLAEFANELGPEIRIAERDGLKQTSEGSGRKDMADQKRDVLEDILSHRGAWTSAADALRDLGTGAKIRICEAAAMATRGELEEGARHAAPALAHIRVGLNVLRDEAETSGMTENVSYWAHELKALDRFEKLVRDLDGQEIVLSDWRLGGDVVKAEPVAVKLTSTWDRIELDLPDGRSLWIEIESENLRVHAYNASKEAPLNLDIPVSGEIVVDNHDYQLEQLCEEEPENGPGL